MARTFQLGALVTRCQQRADLVNHSNISTSEWKENISSAVGELKSILNGTGLRFNEKVFVVQVADFTDNGDNGGIVALPTDFLHAIALDGVLGSQRWDLRELMIQERNIFSGVSAGGKGRAFCLAGNNLIVYPKPSQGSYELGYVPQPTDLSTAVDATEVDVVTPDGENFVVWYVVTLARAKQDLDASFAAAERERARERVREDALRRLLNNARRIVVEDDWNQPEIYDGWWARRP